METTPQERELIYRFNDLLRTDTVNDEVHRRELCREALEILDKVFETNPDIRFWNREDLVTKEQQRAYTIERFADKQSLEPLEKASKELLEFVKKYTDAEREYAFNDLVEEYRHTAFDEVFDDVYNDGYSEGEHSDHAFECASDIIKDQIDVIISELGEAECFYNVLDSRDYCHEYTDRIKEVVNLVEKDIMKTTDEVITDLEKALSEGIDFETWSNNSGYCKEYIGRIVKLYKLLNND